MSFTNWLFGRDDPASTSTSRAGHSKAAFPSPQTSASGGESPHAVHKELLRQVLRDTLKYNGIPVSWIVADTLAATSPRNESGIHLRLVVKHWDSRLPQYAVALQHNLQARMLTLDPQSGSWLMGISWQYDLPAQAQWPSMPAPATWAETAPESEKESIPPANAVAARTREDLEREMDEADERARGSQIDFEATQVLDVRGDGAGGATPPGSRR